ncbi:P-type DNA transfer ATPase VirB11 [Polaromonas sp. CF318]|uniref:P-type DNA transfer ATPase VirB11 n=1 Tax=Polaromonas sp. CF318 TaxID=1144318 RepID=UPI0002711F95|nr:P-type DNA transfer ATPase VirB11 [Polaromonas sp. CF318]EJL77860.1 P-type DNA transfer ATPase VirB11 [Polaromonas sp. CF318]
MNDAVFAEKSREAFGSVYLGAYLEPFREWLEGDEVSEIIVNRPGEVWLEVAGEDAMRRVAAPAVDDTLLRRLSEQVARVTHQGVSRTWPLLSATLPGGARLQVVAPPATRGHWALAIRRHRLREVSLADYAQSARVGKADTGLRIDAADPVGTLRRAVAARATILISGGTSSGKTTFLNSLLREVPGGERVVLIEDTPEIHTGEGNKLALVAVKGELGEARLTTDDLLQAALRLRPDRIVLGELRGKEAVSFLRAINTGHPGSFTTIHANSPQGALEQLALMVLQSGLGLSRADTIAYACSVVDLVVQLDRTGGRRGIAQIVAARELALAMR